jgi:uncharacterized SAM-binding protein YcdF (DUF218 family)
VSAEFPASTPDPSTKHLNRNCHPSTPEIPGVDTNHFRAGPGVDVQFSTALDNHRRTPVAEYAMYDFVVQLLEPYTLLTLSLIAAMTWQWRRQRPRTRLLVTSTILLGFLIVLSLPVTGFLAMRSLEAAYPPSTAVPAPGDTIVVLGGGLILEDDSGEHVRLDDMSLERCLHAVHLYKRAGKCRIVLSGGKADSSIPGPFPAEVMRKFVVETGIHPDDVVAEGEASTTYENAIFSKVLL